MPNTQTTKRKRRCTLYSRLQVVPGTLADFRRLEPYHYRDHHRAPFKAIYALKPKRRIAELTPTDPVGVILYTMPGPNSQLRDIATNRRFAGCDRATRLARLNADVRCICRLIIDPRFRALGLASRLVRETMPLLEVPIIESMAMMGRFHPFFEHAGMTAYHAPPPARCLRLTEAFDLVSITDRDLIDAERTQQQLDALDPAPRQFIDREIDRFLQCYGKRRDMPPGLDRTRFLLGKLTDRPAYYIWFNPKFNAQPSPDSSHTAIPIISHNTAANLITSHIIKQSHHDTS